MKHSDLMYGEGIGGYCAKYYNLTSRKKDFLDAIENNTDIDLKVAAACWEAIDQHEGTYREKGESHE